MPNKTAWILAPIIAGALLIQYAQTGRTTVGELTSATALILALLAR